MSFLFTVIIKQISKHIVSHYIWIFLMFFYLHLRKYVILIIPLKLFNSKVTIRLTDTRSWAQVMRSPPLYHSSSACTLEAVR